MKRIEYFKIILLSVCAFTILLVVNSRPSHAVYCELQPQIEAAGDSFDAGQEAAVQTMLQTLKTLVTSTIAIETPLMVAEIYVLNTTLRTILEFHLITLLDGVLRDMTGELNMAGIDSGRNFGTVMDAQVQTKAQRVMQKHEAEAKRTMTPSQGSCQVDTVNQHFGRAFEVSNAVQRGYELDYASAVTNRAGSGAAEYGSSAVHAEDWDNYLTYFCDPNENGGNVALCPTLKPTSNADVNVSETLFGADTIDLADATTTLATRTMIKNLTGYDVDEPMAPDSFDNLAGQQEFMERRVVQARMSVPVSTISRIIGERAPLGVTAPHIQQMRVGAGIPLAQTTDQPSKNEIQKALKERVWDPEFYLRLGESEQQALQEWAHLKAYNLMQLNDLIARTEEIATMFSVQLAIMMEDMQGGLTNAADAAREM